MAPIGEPPMYCTCYRGAWHGIIPQPPCAYCQMRNRYAYFVPSVWPWPYHPVTTTFTTTFSNATKHKTNDAMRSEDV